MQLNQQNIPQEQLSKPSDKEKEKEKEKVKEKDKAKEKSSRGLKASDKSLHEHFEDHEHEGYQQVGDKSKKM